MIDIEVDVLGLFSDSRLGAHFECGQVNNLRQNDTAHAVFMRGSSGVCYQVLIPVGLLISLDKLQLITGETTLFVDYRLTNHYYGNRAKRVEPIVCCSSFKTIIDSSLFGIDRINMRSRFSKRTSVKRWITPCEFDEYFGSYVAGDVTIGGVIEPLLISVQSKEISLNHASNDSQSGELSVMMPLPLDIRDELEISMFTGVTRDDMASMCNNSLIFYCNMIKYISRKGIELTVVNSAPSIVCDHLTIKDFDIAINEMMSIQPIKCPELAYYISRKESSVTMMNAVIDGIEANCCGTQFVEEFTQEMRMLARTFNFMDIAIAASMDTPDFSRFIDFMTVNQHRSESDIVPIVFGLDMDSLRYSFCQESGFSDSMTQGTIEVANDSILTDKIERWGGNDQLLIEISPSAAVRIIAHLLNDKAYIVEPATELNTNDVARVLAAMKDGDVLSDAVDSVLLTGVGKPFEYTQSEAFNNALRQQGRVANM